MNHLNIFAKQFFLKVKIHVNIKIILFKFDVVGDRWKKMFCLSLDTGKQSVNISIPELHNILLGSLDVWLYM